MSKSIAVIIPSYNYGRFIAAAIQSALRQTEVPAEVIVVDDGSTDDTAAIVGAFDDGVKYVRQTNRGVCAARNRGVVEASSDYIAFLDADDTWEPTKLEKQLREFERNEGIGLAHCGLREFDGGTGDTIRVEVEGAEKDAAENLLLWERPSVNVSGSVIMVTREAFDAVGGFDPDMKVGEDWDFCYRVARRFKVAFVPEPLVNYRSHPAAAHLNVAEMERGMSRFYEKAFADPAVVHLRKRAYGNFHRVIAGSYFQSGEYRKFATHAMKSLWNRPAGLKYFLQFPVRRMEARRDPGADKNA